MTSSGSEDEDFQVDPNRFMRGKKPVEDDGRKVSFWVGRVFVSVDAFREKLREYVIQEGFDIVRVKNERTRVTVKCAGEGCRWCIPAAPTPKSGTFVVRTLHDEHSCIRSTKNKNAISSWIAKKFASRIKNNPEMKLSGMRNELLEEYGIEVHSMRLYRAKRKCMDAIEGNHGECYGKFPAYADVVRYHNPRSLLKLQCERLHMTSNPSFKNFFVCLEAMKTGFINGCRPFLGVSLMLLVSTFPEANQRHCCRHLYNNFKARFSGILLTDRFWDAARACNKEEFNESMDAMKRIDIVAYNWLMTIPVSQWSRHAFDPRVKNDSLTNNMSESFNQWVGELRCKPVLTMIDTIRCRLMSRTHKRYQKGSGWTNEITLAIMGKLDSIKQKSRTCHTMFAGGDEYEVIDGNRRHVVRLGRWDCDCRAWYISGIPCPSQEPMTQASVNQDSGICSSNASGSVLGRGMGTEGRGSACDGGDGGIGRGRGKGSAGDGVIGRGRGNGRVGSGGPGCIGLGRGKGREGGNGMPGGNAIGMAGRSDNGRARGRARSRARGSGVEWAWL
ncbi:hypothetical protein L1049_001201 [Liquidambar formosana]|uniref:Transposase MuDR plant domain-containing protein n=1 Tax=Liquidambar formosana TaxID=63359 RepID=A0AAP0R5Y7_LIQFO